MNNKKHTLISRRQFTRRAAVLSATASVFPLEVAFPAVTSAAEPQQLPDNLPKLSLEGHAEAEARYQMVLSRHGARLSDEQKESIRTMCFMAQPGLERLRAFSMDNGDVPALILRPIVEREKPPGPNHDLVPPAAATAKKP